MTPRQARIALTGFALLAAGVTANALYRQEGAPANRKTAEQVAPHAPAAHKEKSQPGRTRPSADQAKRTAMLKPNSTRVYTLPDATEEASADTIRAIQRELKQRGYGPLASDGAMRPVTRAAIMAFEHDNRLPLTGEATEPLLKRLVLGAPAVAEAAGVGEVRSPHAEAVIKQVQRLLTDRGYRPGQVDGRLSAETVAAIRLFESDQGLAPKGHVSAEVFSRLQDRAAGPTVHAER